MVMSLFLLFFILTSGKCKDLQRRGEIHQVFCLGGTVKNKITEPGNARKMFHECDILDIDSDYIWKRVNLACFVSKD